jgi:hypothetical protein
MSFILAIVIAAPPLAVAAYGLPFRRSLRRGPGMLVVVFGTPLRTEKA